MKKKILAMTMLSCFSLGSPIYAVTLNDLHINFLNDDSNMIKFGFKDGVVKPSEINYSDNIIHLKFDKLKNNLKNDYFDINEDGIKNIRLKNGNNDLNVYISLDEAKKYNSQIFTDGYGLTLKSAEIKHQEYKDIAKINSNLLIDDIQFDHESNDQGEIIISHNSKNPIYDVVEFNGGVELTFDNASITSKLFKNVDVSEYNTPIERYITKIENGNAIVKIFFKENSNANYVVSKQDHKLIIIIKSLSSKKIEKNINIDRNNKISFKGELIDFDFQDIPIKDALFTIAKTMGLNLVMADNIEGNLTLLLKNVPYDQALDIILKTKGLGKHIEGNIMLIAPLEEIMQREEFELTSKKKINDIKPLKTKTIQIKYAKSQDVYNLLDKIKSDRGKIIYDSRTNKMFLEDNAEKLFEMENLIEKIDIPIRQVSVEARIVYAKKNISNALGVKWKSGVDMSNYNPINGSNIGIGSGSTIGSLGNATNALGLSLGFINANVDMTLQALEKNGDIDIVSKPLIISADKKKSKIASGKEFPYREISDNGDVTTSFKEIKLSLEVTPQITPDDKLIMDLSIIQDSIAELTDAGPALDSTDIDTQVIVDNNQTLVLGGVFKTEEVNGKEKVPLLGDIPLIGNAFSYNEKTNEKVELLIFITPKILNGDEVIKE